jgi:FKBP-type peptidyl-prolyl cis-trans isomerase
LPVVALGLLALTTDIAWGQTLANPPVAQQSGADFMAANAKAAGVQTLPSGLQYKIVHSGPVGPSPKAGDIIKVHYEGSLISGQVFDSSFSRGKPAIMALANLVPAWMEALPLMHVGDEWILYAPPELGYGPEAAGPIPANSVLIFRLQLLGMLTRD